MVIAGSQLAGAQVCALCAGMAGRVKEAECMPEAVHHCITQNRVLPFQCRHALLRLHRRCIVLVATRLSGFDTEVDMLFDPRTISRH